MIEIDKNFENLKKMSKESFKKLVEKKVRKAALKDLIKRKNSHSKMKNLEYSELELQPYFKSKLLFKTEAQNLFRYRTRMADFKNNFKNGNTNISCLLCPIGEDSQNHILECEVIVAECPEIKMNTIQYEDIFSRDVNENKKALLALTKAVQTRDFIVN